MGSSVTGFGDNDDALNAREAMDILSEKCKCRRLGRVGEFKCRTGKSWRTVLTIYDVYFFVFIEFHCLVQEEILCDALKVEA